MIRALSILLAVSIVLAADCPYRLLLSDMLAHELVIREPDGTIFWRLAEPRLVFDGRRLASGTLLYAWYAGGKAGVREVAIDGSERFRYEVAGECHTVQRLPDGSTMLADPSRSRLIVVSPTGAFQRELRLETTTKQMHRVNRLARVLPDGRWVVVQEGDRAVVVYDAEGRALRRITCAGMPYGVEALANGNLLIAGGSGKDVSEVAPDGTVVWHCTAADFPADGNLEWIIVAHRLPNGNTLVGNWLGHGKDGKGTSLWEMTPDRRVLWTLAERRIINVVQVLSDEIQTTKTGDKYL